MKGIEKEQFKTSGEKKAEEELKERLDKQKRNVKAHFEQAEQKKEVETYLEQIKGEERLTDLFEKIKGLSEEDWRKLAKLREKHRESKP